MDFNLDEMTAEELDELLAKIQAKLDAMENGEQENDGEDPEEESPEGNEGDGDGEGEDPEDDIPDDLEELGKLVDKILGRKAEIAKQAQKRSKIMQRLANGGGRVVRTFKENGGNEKMTYGIETKEYRSAFLKNLQGKPVNTEERAALANGSYAIPQETMNKIWGAMELYPLLNAVDVMHVPGTVILPVEGAVNDAKIVAMGDAATDSEDSLKQVSLGVYKMIKTIEITADVEAMAVDAFENWLVDRLANKMYRLVTKKIAAGTGSAEPEGLTTIDADGQTYSATITFTDILAIIATLPTEWTPNATFVMSRTTFWQNVLAVKDNENRPIVVADAQSPAKFNLMGFPVILEDEVGTDIIFGDLKEGYAFNFGKDIAIDRDESVGFRSGSVVYRGMCLGDGKPTGVGLVRYTKGA